MSEAALRSATRSIIADIQRLETMAFEAGLNQTSRALNSAKNAAGWEAAELLERMTPPANNQGEVNGPK